MHLRVVPNTAVAFLKLVTYQLPDEKHPLEVTGTFFPARSLHLHVCYGLGYMPVEMHAYVCILTCKTSSQEGLLS